MQNNTPQEIWEKLSSAKKVLMSLHYGPDGDSLGSCTAMKYFLERDFKAKVKIVSYDQVSENMAAMPFAKEVEFGKDISEENPEDYDLYFSVDCASPNWLSGKARDSFSFPKNKDIINIDHHKTNEYFGSLNYVLPESGSTCAILVDLLKSWKVEFDKELSTRLMLGISTDSGFFTFKGNIHESFEKAVFLMNHQAEYIEKIVNPLLLNQPLKIKKLNAFVISNLKTNAKLRYAYASIPLKIIQEMKLNNAELRLGVTDIQQLAGFDFIFTLTETDKEIKGSIRSPKGLIDSSEIAEALGGGGHKEAAGFFLPKMPLDQAEKIVIDIITKTLANKK